MKISVWRKGVEHFATIDDSDYELVSQYKWFLIKGYAVTQKYLGGGRKNAKYKTIQMHKLINDTPDGLETDHINRDKLDNRRSNLRSVTKSENMLNRAKWTHKTPQPHKSNGQFASRKLS